jgi:hypothetical protein
MSDELRTVNGVELSCGYTWLTDGYLITTDSYSAATSGVGYFTVSRVAPTTYPNMELIYIDRMLSLADAVTLTKTDAASRKIPVPVIPREPLCFGGPDGLARCGRTPTPDVMVDDIHDATCPACLRPDSDPVPHFHAGWHMPGYLPETPYEAFAEFSEARSYVLAELERYWDHVDGTDDAAGAVEAHTLWHAGATHVLAGFCVYEVTPVPGCLCPEGAEQLEEEGE